MRLLTIVFFLACQALAAQTLSDSATISLMTVAPGKFVYSTFGHSALRVRDPEARFDRCYNYGTFDFEQPNFVLKFCQGRLLYNLDIETYRSFEYGNLRDRRPMQEQQLNLNKEQRQRLFELLEENYKEENRYYQYDFFYDNCATRIRDIVEETFFHQIRYDTAFLPLRATMRQLLQPYLDEKPWLGFGIDLVLGLPADRVANASHYMFLPDYVHHLFAKAATPDGNPLVLRERNIPEKQPPPPSFMPGPLDRPLWVMGFIVVIGLLSMADPRTEKVFDTVFWFVLGLAGLIIFLLWFATDHSATKSNMNILWAWPTHLFFFWRRRKNSPFVENYFTAAALVAALLILFWAWLPQELPAAALPIAGLVVLKGLWKK